MTAIVLFGKKSCTMKLKKSKSMTHLIFSKLPAPKPDAILALMGKFRADERSEKIDLGVGVYRDAEGATPVMRSVKAAQEKLVNEETTKTYVGPTGDAEFNALLSELALGESVPKDRVACMQTPGGSGALRVLFELVNEARPGSTVWVSDPTWANHIPMLLAAGLQYKSYPYFDAESGNVRFDDMLSALRKCSAGDAILLHACCHNPTGANLTLEQWQQVAEVLIENELLPFFDMAYQGFGDGFEQDAAGMQLVASMVPECVVALSCSKNFAVYRDRVGAAVVVGATAEDAKLAMGQMGTIARRSYSMPPNHGAAVVKGVLQDEQLKADWIDELESMRLNMLNLRKSLANELRRLSNSDRFDFLAAHRGMFSRLGLTPAQVDWLREERAIYMVGDSRINIAGLPADKIEHVAAAIIDSLAHAD